MVARPTAQRVPAGFAATAIIECRDAVGDPDTDDVLTVQRVTYTGAISPLLAALARDSEPSDPDVACEDRMWEPSPVLYLVDDQDRAMLATIPRDVCGWELPAVIQALDLVRENATVAETITQSVSLG